MSYEARCAICEQPVNFEESKTEERGHAVHENCYVWTVQLISREDEKNKCTPVHHRQSPLPTH
jgi:hypothetical protein